MGSGPGAAAGAGRLGQKSYPDLNWHGVDAGDDWTEFVVKAFAGLVATRSYREMLTLYRNQPITSVFQPVAESNHETS